MIFDKVKNFSIVFGSPPEFGSGGVVSGKVVLELSGQSRVQALTLHAEGVAKTRFIVATDACYYREDVECLNQRGELLPADDGELSLSRGRHEFPFSFQLPERLETSFEGKHGSIRYWVKVKLHRPWATVKKIKKEFTVIQPIDINTPTLLAPHDSTKDKMARLWFQDLGKVSIRANIDRTGYTPGEVIPVLAEFNNPTSRPVVPKAYITQVQTFIGEGNLKEKRVVVAMLRGDAVGAYSREVWHGLAIKIPPVGPSILHCRIIKVEYMLRVCVNVPGMSKLCVELPLVMGTKALHLSDSGISSSVINNQYSGNLKSLANPEKPESPPDYSSVVTEEEQRTSSPPPTYSEVYPIPPHCLTVR